MGKRTEIADLYSTNGQRPQHLQRLLHGLIGIYFQGNDNLVSRTAGPSGPLPSPTRHGWELHAGTRLPPTEAAFGCPAPPTPTLRGLLPAPPTGWAEPSSPALQPNSPNSRHDSTLSSCSEAADRWPLRNTRHTQGGWPSSAGEAGPPAAAKHGEGQEERSPCGSLERSLICRK